ncbi:MAG: hydrogenase maturation protease [Acidimicrobiia bacterium]|nr:hydrogenase maturation protease [Acidimicrobiia bacterium]
MGDRTVVIGIGNRDRGDDAVGPAVLDRLAGPLPADVETVCTDGDPGDVLEALAGCRRTIVVDAVSPAGRPGRLVRMTDRTALASVRPSSSHALGPAEVLDLAAQLERLPADVVVYGIEGAAFGPGRPMSPAVEDAVEVAVGMILEEVADA